MEKNDIKKIAKRLLIESAIKELEGTYKTPSIVVARNITKEDIYELQDKYPILEVDNILSIQTKIVDGDKEYRQVTKFINSSTKPKILVVNVNNIINETHKQILMRLKYVMLIGENGEERIDNQVLVILMSDNQEKYLNLNTLIKKFPSLFQQSFYL